MIARSVLGNRRRTLRRIVALLGMAIVLATAGDLFAGWLLVMPYRTHVGEAPADLGATSVVIPTPQGRSLRGWLVKGRSGAGALLLMHGIRGDRRQMLPVARRLARDGFAILMFDFQAEGESDGDHISIGFRESDDARAALEFLKRSAPREKVGAIGSSMGGAAALLGTAPLQVDALVLEAVYPTIEQATAARISLHLGSIAGGLGRSLGQPLAPLLLWQLRFRLGIGPEQLRPVEAVKKVRAPVLVLIGDHDRFLPVEEGRRVFDAAPEPKGLWIVPGADHESIEWAEREEYERRVREFLRRWLR
jgi:pimeloyl-ACP methyl ester carboxylesterase